MAKQKAQQKATVVVSNLTVEQARALIAGASTKVEMGDALHTVLNSGTGFHAWRPSTVVRLADKAVLAGDVLTVAASKFEQRGEGESPVAFAVRAGIAAWKNGMPGMVRALGSWKKSDAPAAHESTF